MRRLSSLNLRYNQVSGSAIPSRLVNAQTLASHPRPHRVLATPLRAIRTVKMSSISLTDLQYITRETLSDKFKASQGLPANTAVVDVRDSDHIGGHIRGSTWVPSSQLDYKTPELVRELKDKEVVVFHCALSQQRGPSAALRYMREKERLDGFTGLESKGEVKEEGPVAGQGQGGEGKDEKESEAKGKQRVYVLKGGFTEWQEKYGEDRLLTEGYQKDIWEFGY